MKLGNGSRKPSIVLKSFSSGKLRGSFGIDSAFFNLP